MNCFSENCCENLKEIILKKSYIVPAYFEVKSYLEVEAESPQEALKWLDENQLVGDIPLDMADPVENTLDFEIDVPDTIGAVLDATEKYENGTFGYAVCLSTQMLKDH